MRIDPTAPPPPLRPARSTRRVGDGGFALPDGEDEAAASAPTHETRNTAPTAASAAVDTLLALQLADDPKERRRRALRRGGVLLDGLETLKKELLDGQISGRSIAALRQALAERVDDFEDPGLASVVASIEQRAAVELAKLERARKR